MSPLDAKESIGKASGTDFDPGAVEAFASYFRLGPIGIPEVMV
jgi:HD-GYP domain-containing protein (c-di-GMP phosphodiesterase class II)